MDIFSISIILLKITKFHKLSQGSRHACMYNLSQKTTVSTAPAHRGVISQIYPPPPFAWFKMTHTKGSKLYTHAWRNHAHLHDCLKNRSFLPKANSWGWDFSNLTKTPQLLPSSNWPKPNTFRESYRSFIWRINRVKEMVETCPWLHSTHSSPLALTQERASLGF